MGTWDESYRAQAEMAFRRAETTDSDFAHISAESFNRQFESHRAVWAIGPFQRDPAMTFRKPGSWLDPLGIGWTSGAVWNPTLIERDDRLFMFYRCGPRKESLSSRIGLAIYDGTAWEDFSGNPVIYPVTSTEVLSCEDPKLYRSNDLYYLFYQGIYPLPPEARTLVAEELFSQDIGCDIHLAVSRDLVHWERVGSVVPHEISRYWAKAAVIPRNAHGEAVRIGGKFLMFLSEGCGHQQYLGYSRDLVDWDFRPQAFLPTPRDWRQIHEVACAVIDERSRPGQLILDVFYRTAHQQLAAGQVRYDVTDPTRPQESSLGGTLAWGGLMQYQGNWLYAQGWDAPPGEQSLYFYRAPVEMA